jgi:hypothetical protein
MRENDTANRLEFAVRFGPEKLAEKVRESVHPRKLSHFSTRPR